MSIHPIAGIDYGNGVTNINDKTGIRYGVISVQSVLPEAMDDFIPVYDDNPNDQESYDDIPAYYEYLNDGYDLRFTPDSTFIWVSKSPYITECKFCSPCVPGAGDLDNPIIGGIKTYCLDSSWFEDNKAPYEYTKLE